MNTIEQIIRESAYRLWDRAGRPEGRSEEFWFTAKAEFAPKEEATRERRLAAHARRSSANVRCETAADWSKRGRNPNF